MLLLLLLLLPSSLSVLSFSSLSSLELFLVADACVIGVVVAVVVGCCCLLSLLFVGCFGVYVPSLSPLFSLVRLLLCRLLLLAALVLSLLLLLRLLFVSSFGVIVLALVVARCFCVCVRVVGILVVVFGVVAVVANGPSV